MEKSKYFQDKSHVKAYSSFRPRTPEDVAVKSMEYLKTVSQNGDNKFELMIDIGCGGGQSTDIFAPYFKKIIGIDRSETQLEAARQVNTFDHITYAVGDAQNLDFEDNSLDLACVGQAVHWFNIPDFFKECNRVLKPNGYLLLHGYDRPRISVTDELDKVADDLYTEFYDQCTFNPVTRHVEDHYKTIYGMLNADKKHRIDSVVYKMSFKISDFIHFLRSWSGCSMLVTEHSADLISNFIASLKKHWGVADRSNDDIVIHATFPYYIVISGRPKC